MVESTLSQYSEFFNIAGIFEGAVRDVLFSLVNILAYISDGVEGVVDKIYTMNNFFENKQVEGIYNTFKPVLWIILTLSILYIGYKIVIDKEFKCERIFQNFILSSMVILALPTFMTTLNKITTESINVLNKTQIEENTTTAKTLIKDNLYDLKYLESKDFKLDGYGGNTKVATNNINPENIFKIEIDGTIDSGLLSLEDNVFSKKLDIDENGETKVVKMEKTFFGLIKEQYYRYNIDFFNVIVSLVCLVLAFVLTAIKIARIIVELAFKKVFAMTLAFGDVVSGQKLKTILKDILSSFAIIFTTALLLKMYTIGISWIGTTQSNVFVEMFFLIGLSLMVIDAPNVIERILGIDAGIKSGWSVIAGAYTVGKGLGEIGNIASDMVGKATNVIAGATGGAKGIYDGFKGSSLEDERKNSSSSSENSSKSSDNLNDNTNDNLSKEMKNSDNDDISTSSNTEGIDDDISTSYGEQNSLSEDMNKISSNDEQSTLGDDISSSDGKGTLESDIDSSLQQSTLGDDISSSDEKGTLESDIGSNSQQSTLGDDISSSDEKGTLESDTSIDSVSSSEPSQLDSDISSNTISNETGSLETDLNEDSKLSGKSLSNINDQDKMSNLCESDKSISDKNKESNSPKIENRSLGENVKEKVSDEINSSSQVQNAKKYYDLGTNTGNKLNKMLKGNKDKE